MNQLNFVEVGRRIINLKAVSFVETDLDFNETRITFVDGTDFTVRDEEAKLFLGELRSRSSRSQNLKATTQWKEKRALARKGAGASKRMPS